MEEEKKDPITPEESRETIAEKAEIKKPVEQEVKETLETTIEADPYEHNITIKFSKK